MHFKAIMCHLKLQIDLWGNTVGGGGLAPFKDTHFQFQEDEVHESGDGASQV
jgi:hypothetical protein